MAPIELHLAGISPNLSRLGPALAELDHICPAISERRKAPARENYKPAPVRCGHCGVAPIMGSRLNGNEDMAAGVLGLHDEVAGSTMPGRLVKVVAPPANLASRQVAKRLHHATRKARH